MVIKCNLTGEFKRWGCCCKCIYNQSYYNISMDKIIGYVCVHPLLEGKWIKNQKHGICELFETKDEETLAMIKQEYRKHQL